MAEPTFRPDGRSIRDLMDRLDLTQEALAERAGVGLRTIQSMEAAVGDQTIRHKWTTLQAVANALGLKGENAWREIVVEDVETDSGRRDSLPGRVPSARDAATLSHAGILAATDEFDGETFAEMVRRTSGDIVIINTWIETFEGIRPILKEVLVGSNNRRVAIYRLKAGADAAERRARELPADNVTASFEYTNARIDSFLTKDLTAEQRGRVTVHDMKEMPRFTIHAAGESCLVGFFWLTTTAARGPHLRIDGRVGGFARHVWEYIDHVRRTNLLDTQAERVEPKGPRGKRKR